MPGRLEGKVAVITGATRDAGGSVINNDLVVDGGRIAQFFERPPTGT